MLKYAKTPLSDQFWFIILYYIFQNIYRITSTTGGPNCVFLQMRFAQMRFFEKTQLCSARLRFKRNCVLSNCV